MKAKPLITRFLATALSILVFLAQCVFAHAAEVNFWTQRSNAQLASALPPIQKENHIAGSAWDLPSECGSLRTVLRPDSSCDNHLTVIHIQDVHQNAEAQSNISKTLKTLLDKNQVAMVALEGAFDELQLNSFQTYPYPEVIQTVADNLLKNKQLSGPLHAALTSPQATSVAFVGVDDQRHYDENVAAYLNAAPCAEKAKKALAEKKQELVRKKESTLSTALRKFDSTVECYQQDQISLSAYAQTLLETEKFSGQHENIVHFLEAARLESTLDSNAVERERAQLISILARKLSPAAMTEFSNQTIAFRVGQLTHAHFYSNLQRLCDAHDIQLAQFPSMQRYLRYVMLSDGIDAKKLFQELRRTEKTVYAALERTSEETALIEQSHVLNLTGKLLDFSLTREEWNEYRQISKTTDALKSFEAFYEEASLRDDDMANSFLKNSATAKAGLRVLVTGGFHSSDIDEKLAKTGYTVMSFVPKISKVDLGSGSAYLSVFAQEKTPLEKLFAGEKLFLCPLQKNGLINAIPEILELSKLWHPDAVINHLFKELLPRLSTNAFAFAFTFWKWMFVLIRNGRDFDINIADIGPLAAEHDLVNANVVRLRTIADVPLKFHNSRKQANADKKARKPNMFRPTLAPFEIHLIGTSDDKVIDPETGQRAHAGGLSTIGTATPVKRLWLARGFYEDDPFGAIEALCHEADELKSWWHKATELWEAKKIKIIKNPNGSERNTFRDWIAANEDVASILQEGYHKTAQARHPTFKYYIAEFSDFLEIRNRFVTNAYDRLIRADGSEPLGLTPEEQICLFRISHAANMSPQQRAQLQGFLVRANVGLVYDRIKSRDPEIITLGMHGLWEAVRIFDFTLAQELSTLAYPLIGHAISKGRKDRRRIREHSGSEDDHEIMHLAVARNEADPSMTDEVIAALANLTRIEQVIVKLKYGFGTTPHGTDYSAEEIAAMIHRSLSGVNATLEKAREKMSFRKRDTVLLDPSRSHLDLLLLKNGTLLDNPSLAEEILSLDEPFHLTEDPVAKQRIAELKSSTEIRKLLDIREELNSQSEIGSPDSGISFSPLLNKHYRFLILNRMAFALADETTDDSLSFASFKLKWSERLEGETSTPFFLRTAGFTYEIMVDLHPGKDGPTLEDSIETQAQSWAKMFAQELTVKKDFLLQDTSDISFPDRLQILRNSLDPQHKLNLSLEDLDKAIGQSPGLWRRWEGGSTTPSSSLLLKAIERISRKYEHPVGSLYDFLFPLKAIANEPISSRLFRLRTHLSRTPEEMDALIGTDRLWDKWERKTANPSTPDLRAVAETIHDERIHSSTRMFAFLGLEDPAVIVSQLHGMSINKALVHLSGARWLTNEQVAVGSKIPITRYMRWINIANDTPKPPLEKLGKVITFYVDTQHFNRHDLKAALLECYGLKSPTVLLTEIENLPFGQALTSLRAGRLLTPQEAAREIGFKTTRRYVAIEKSPDNSKCTKEELDKIVDFYASPAHGFSADELKRALKVPTQMKLWPLTHAWLQRFAGESRLVIKRGMRYGDKFFWWGKYRLRGGPIPWHTGDDDALREDLTGNLSPLEPGTVVPAIAGGTVVAKFKSDLQWCLIVDTGIKAPQGRHLLLIYMHMSPIDPATKHEWNIGDTMHVENNVGTLEYSAAEPGEVTKSIVAAHLHRSAGFMDPNKFGLLQNVKISGPDLDQLAVDGRLEYIDPMTLFSPEDVKKYFRIDDSEPFTVAVFSDEHEAWPAQQWLGRSIPSVRTFVANTTVGLQKFSTTLPTK